jgi:hypothetical protein
MARVHHEIDADGRRIERVEVGGPRVKVQQVAPDRRDVHPELRPEQIIHETYAADSPEMREFREAQGREGERELIDGAVSGQFPRKSRLSAAMVEADLDADALAAKAMLPAELIRDLIDNGEVPGPDQRRQLEACVPDPFPEAGELIEPTPNELAGEDVSSPRERRRGEPTPTRDEAEGRSRRRAQLAAEVRSEANRRAATARRQGERDAARLKELDRGLSGIVRKLGIGRQ